MVLDLLPNLIGWYTPKASSNLKYVKTRTDLNVCTNSKVAPSTKLVPALKVLPTSKLVLNSRIIPTYILTYLPTYLHT